MTSLNVDLATVVASLPGGHGGSAYYQLAGQGNNTLTAIEAHVGGSNSFYFDLVGTAGDDALNGKLWGNGEYGVSHVDYRDALSAVQANLATGTAAGGSGNDTFANINSVFGSNFDDVLVGNGSFNNLFGDAGNDTLQGMAGDDILTGGASGDIFVFAANGGNDTVTDFQDGQDLIRLDGIFASSSDQAFLDFVANLQASANGDHTIDGLPGVTITLTGVEVKTLQANDFVIHA